MAIFTDQIGQQIILTKSPTRIISLVPSQTELLCDLGLDAEVIGITKFCIHPTDWFKSKTRIGGTKNVNITKAQALQPDLIIANKEENTKADIEALQQFCPVWVSDISNLSEALAMIASIGELTEKSTAANAIIRQIQTQFDALLPTKQSIPVLYLIWKNPYMAAGADTFIDDMLCRCGYYNVLKNVTRYPEVDIAAFKNIPNLTVLLSSEPYPFKEKDIIALHQILPNATIHLVDGELFSWYGSRLLQAPAYFKQLLNK